MEIDMGPGLVGRHGRSRGQFIDFGVLCRFPNRGHHQFEDAAYDKVDRGIHGLMSERTLSTPRLVISMIFRSFVISLSMNFRNSSGLVARSSYSALESPIRSFS